MKVMIPVLEFSPDECSAMYTQSLLTPVVRLRVSWSSEAAVVQLYRLGFFKVSFHLSRRTLSSTWVTYSKSVLNVADRFCNFKQNDI